VPFEAELPPQEDYIEEVNGESFDMIYVAGGTFTLGCESAPCPQYSDPVENIAVSSYLIAKNQVTNELYDAVMGGSGTSLGALSITWYQAHEFACELSKLTGLAYRMMTEAEFEYAAKNHAGSLGDLGGGEEWAYNSWETSYSCQPGDSDPVGPSSGEHTQKTRRDTENTADNITGRLIRSIDGIGPQLRLVVSAEVPYPPHYKPTCDIQPPHLGEEPVNSYRDPRWVTGSDARWTTGSLGIGTLDLQVWEDGTARYDTAEGQWFTSNNIAFVFVPSSGTHTKLSYIFLDENQGSVISDTGFMSGGYVGRFQRESTSGTKPTIDGLMSGAELAAAAGADYEMIDMQNIPPSDREQDPRLLDGPSQGWFQDNTSAGGVHHYRKDVDADEFRFTVNQAGTRTMLANGAWFTVNNTFLRVIHEDGYTADYLYAVDGNGTFYHNSFQGYERADFRIFEKTDNGSATLTSTCGSICENEIPKGEPESVYANIEGGESSFVPAPCPAQGCE